MSSSAVTSVVTSPAMRNLAKAFTSNQLAGMTETAALLRGTRDSTGTANIELKSMSKKAIGVSKATRPLNSWMAFRCYYSPIFATFQQKEISGVLTVLWQEDPSKAKWSILAKGYSVIRDSKGKGNTPLDIFLAINGPFMGVIAPDAYLGTLGWSMIMGEAGQVAIRRVAGFKLAPLDQKLLTSTMSVDDIIQHSIDHGFISENGASLTMPSHQPNLTMASSAQPIHVSSHTDDAGVSCSIAVAATDTDVLDKDVTSAGNARGRDQTWALTQVLKIQAQIEADDQAKMGIGATAAVAVEEELYAEEPVVHEVEDPNFMLASDFYTLEGEYPFNNEFNPDLPAFTFDPFMGDDFCGYNMSDWVNPEAYEEDFDAEN